MPTDALDARIITLFTDEPRMSVLEASRTLQVARATVQARLDRMQRLGVISGWGPGWTRPPWATEWLPTAH